MLCGFYYIHTYIYRIRKIMTARQDGKDGENEEGLNRLSLVTKDLARSSLFWAGLRSLSFLA